MPVIDVATFIGAYPYRYLDHGDAEWLLEQMDRLGIEQAWVGHLPSILWKDPGPGNVALFQALGAHRDRLFPVPILHVGLPCWRHDLERALDAGAPAVRLFPQYHGTDPTGPSAHEAIAALGQARLPAVLTVRLEDARQRHPLDLAADLPAAAVRALVRRDLSAKVIVTHADRAFIEEVHFGLTPGEAARVSWDISGVWGPPEDHLRLLLETVGADRFVLGTGMPLRIPDAPFAKLDLLELSSDSRKGILGGNLRHWLGSP